LQVERIFWLAWAQISGIGPILLRRLEQHFGTLERAWEATPAQLGEVEGFGERTISTLIQKRSLLDPEKFYQQHLEQNPNFWTPADRAYPRLLLEIPNPPPVLYYRGRVELEENSGIIPSIAIVGTRDPDEYGKRWTRKIATALIKKGFTVVSGMAEGIDTVAHQACIDGSGRTIAVLGTGVDVIYPPRNHRLYEDIQAEGLVVSEYPSGTQPNRPHFPQRNRIIAGLSRAIVVTQAPTKSGALITAHLANDFCRDVYVLPADVDRERSLGCLGLLSRGAHPIITPGHLLDLLGSIPELDSAEQLQLFSPTTSTPLPNLEPELQQVLDAIASQPTPFDAIVQQTGLAASSVSSALLQLELQGLVSQLPGMQYQRS
jgi:DNA processing protein